MAGNKGKQGRGKSNYKEGTIILAEVPDDSVPSQLALLLLGTGQEQRTPICCKCDCKKVLTLFTRKLEERERPQRLLKDLFSTWFYLQLSTSLQ